MINSIDEAIAHAREKAEEHRKAVITDEYICNQGYKDSHNAKCLECAKEHEQLAEWLEELAEWRKLELICANKGVFVYMKRESEAENE